MRTKKGILNFLSGYVFYFVLAILGFIKVRVFISSLGDSLYALNQLYVNLFSYLTLAEAGIGAAFTYRLYKKLADKDYDGINKIYSGTKAIFRNIGFLIIALGLVCAFFVPFLIKGNMFNNLYLYLTFMLFIGQNVVDYFMMVPRYIMQADQQQYKINIRYYGFRIFEVCLQIFLLYLAVDYVFILIPSIFIAIGQNIAINRKINKIYPWLKETKDKDFSNKEDIKHMVVHRLTGVISNNIDIVILSSFTSSVVVTVYASYNYLTKFAIDTTAQIFNALKDGLGNVVETESKEKIKKIIDEFFVLFSYIATIVTVFLFIAMNDFVTLWVGKKYVISLLTLVLFLIILYYQISIRSISIVRTAMGLFKETKVMAAVEALLNLILSLILVKFLGLNGVLIGTIIAFLATNFWYFPYVIYKKLFNIGILEYMLKLLLNIILVLALCLLINPIYNLINIGFIKVALINWLFNSLIVGVIIVAITSICYYFLHPEFKVTLNRIKHLIKQKTVKSL